MATIKAYTSIEQSKKLAEILPLESADMWWAERYAGRVTENGQYVVAEKPYYYPSLVKPSDINYSQDTIKDIPVWSLAALLGVLPYPSLHKTFIGWRCDSYDKEGQTCRLGENADNPVDTCYEMILKLLH